MTEVYLPRPTEGYELCHPLRDSDFESFNALVNGEPRTDTWSPIDMRLVHEDQGEVLKRSDSPWLGSHALIFRKEVMFRFGQFLQEFGELLALKCDEAEMFVYNPTCLIDGLDEENSEIQRFSNGRIIRISKYAFNESRIADLDAFKIPGLRVSPTFVSDRFVREWTSMKFVGLSFEKIWPLEN